MKENLPAGAAIAAAAAASLCCIGPLLFILMGLGAFGASAFFESLRPYLLGAAVLLPAFGFYGAYFRRGDTSCGPGEACAAKPVTRTTRVCLWVSAVTVLAFALSPYYAGTLARRLNGNPTQPTTQQSAIARAAFKVSGMACTGCEQTIKLALDQTPGVHKVEVSYDRGEAVVEYDTAIIDAAKIQKAIDETGYTCEIKR